jgi:predicted amidohydrolase YtcJ
MAVAQPAAYVLHNARIYTVDEAGRVAAAMAVADGVIAAVGPESEVLAGREDWPRLDAGGRVVVPGLIDAHGHLMELGRFLLNADLRGARSKAEVVDRLRAHASNLPADAWITGRGWDQNLWSDPVFPTASDLDSAFPDRPVFVIRVDGHAGWGNSAALRAAGLDPAAVAPADPEGGRIIRDEAGRPTGVLMDFAIPLVEEHIPEASDALLEARLDAALAATARAGLTGLHEAGIDEAGIQDRAVALYRRRVEEGRFPLRLYAMAIAGSLTVDEVCHGGPDIGPRLVLRSVKFYIDGALGSRGAALLEEYEDDPGNRGILVIDTDSLAAAAADLMRCGLQVNSHAIGDRGVRTVLDAYEQAIAATGGGEGRHRVEHAQVVSDADIPRFSELGVIAAVQPTHATSDMPWAEERLGPDRIRGAYAWRRLVDAGARLALGSDFPVEQVSPLLGFYAAVTRQDADGHPPGGWRAAEMLNREEALRGFTIDAAYAGFMEDEIGSLEPGKRADFVILSRDIMTIPAAEILETQVVATYLDGETIYRGDD